MASMWPLGILVEPGKLVGDLPVDGRKVAAWFAGISVPLMILLAILL